MRAREFISEDAGIPKAGPIPKQAVNSSQGTILSRDIGGYDRIYHMNRLWMAMACSDGKSTKAPEGVDASSFAEKYNTIHPYTEVERNMVKQAMAVVPTDSHDLIKDHRSIEQDDVHKVSPVSSFRGYNYKKKK